MSEELKEIKELFKDAYEKVSKLNEKLNNKLTEEEIDELINWCYDHTKDNGHIVGESFRSVFERVNRIDV
jgi:uncharacterized protein YktB (UPF0637 family)